MRPRRARPYARARATTANACMLRAEAAESRMICSNAPAPRARQATTPKSRCTMAGLSGGAQHAQWRPGSWTQQAALCVTQGATNEVVFQHTKSFGNRSTNPNWSSVIARARAVHRARPCLVARFRSVRSPHGVQFGARLAAESVPAYSALGAHAAEHTWSGAPGTASGSRKA